MTFDVKFSRTSQRMDVSFGNVQTVGGGGTGQDGISPIVTLEERDVGVDITVTDAEGTKTATVRHGKDGANGKDGEPGYTPVKGVDYFDGKDGAPGKDGEPGKDGAPGKNGYTPVKGVDYFDGEPGKDGKDGESAYQYAKDGGYTGTEAEFAAKLAAEIPKPYTLPTASETVKGGVRVGPGLWMDGDVLGTGVEKWKLIDTIVGEDMAFSRDKEPDGTPYKLKEIVIVAHKPSSVVQEENIYIIITLDETTIGSLYIQSTSDTRELKVYCELVADKGLWRRGRANNWGVPNQQATPITMFYEKFEKPIHEGEYIRGLRTTNKLSSGVVLSIWGVRA